MSHYFWRSHFWIRYDVGPTEIPNSICTSIPVAQEVGFHVFVDAISVGWKAMSTAMSYGIYEDELKQLWIAVLTPSSMRQDQFGRASRKIRHFVSKDNRP
jgi:hypothetical protein